MKTRMVISMSAALVMFVALPVLADWDPGDYHKMHFPQLPDPNGWDVNIDPFDDLGMAVGDDWLCTESGEVSDIHLWASWQDDIVGELEAINVEIYTDDRSDPLFSKPGDIQWTRSFSAAEISSRWYGDGIQGWYDPWTGAYEEDDHFDIYQYNIEYIDDPFIQEEGTIYWLVVYAFTTDGKLGWKTSLDHYEDGAVTIRPNDGVDWDPLLDPVTSLPLDMAFVITPEPVMLTLLAFGSLALIRRRR